MGAEVLFIIMRIMAGCGLVSAWSGAFRASMSVAGQKIRS